MADEHDLRQLNEQFPIKENAGDRLFFESHLAPVFAFRRASGALDSREMFLLSLAAGGKRACDPASIEITLLGKSRALVNCVVTSDADRFHNCRLFIKDLTGRWLVLAWANERVDPGGRSG
jgi:hypothetical protein